MTWLPTLTQIKTLYRANTTEVENLVRGRKESKDAAKHTLKHWSMYPSFLVIEGLVYIRCFNPSVEEGGFVLYRDVENNTMRKLSIEEIEKHFTSMMEVVDLSKPVRASKTTHYECSSKGYDQLLDEYFSLWDTWCSNHQVWMHELHYLAACCNYNLSDGFATTAVNQASALASWLNANHWDGITSLLEINRDENDT